MKKQKLQPKVVTAETVLVTVPIVNVEIIVQVADVPAVVNAVSKKETALRNEGLFFYLITLISLQNMNFATCESKYLKSPIPLILFTTKIIAFFPSSAIINS